MAKKISTTSAADWKTRYTKAQAGQERMFSKFSDYYDTMYAHVNTDAYALWRSKIFIPIIPSKAWAMVAKMQALKPGFEVSLFGEALNDDQAQLRAEKMQWKLEHDWDNPKFDESMPEKLFSPLVDAVVTGTGIAKVPWTFTNDTRYEKYVDEETGELDVTQDVKIEAGTGYNDLIPHDIMATYVAPGAKGLQQAAWVILEDYVTYEQLKAENDAAGFEKYANLDKVKDLKGETDRFASEKQSRHIFVNSSEDDVLTDTTVDQFKRLECYEKSTMYLYVYAVGQNKDGNEDEYIELSKRKLPYWHGKYPLVSFYVKRRPFSFWGQGVFEDTERMQSAFNDVLNHYMDSMNLSLDGMIMKQEGEEYTYIVEPGGEFLYKSQKPEQFKFPEPNPAQFNTIMNFIESQVEEATISRYATGTPNSATDTTAGTASGIQKLTEMAGDKIGFMKQSFGNSLREIGRQWLTNNQQFVDAPITLMGKEKNQPAPITIKPEDLQGEMILRINDASMEPMSKEQELVQFNAFVQQLMQMQQASFAQAQQTRYVTKPLYYDFAALAQDLSQKMGQANFDKLLVDQKEVEEAMQNSQTPMVMPNERIMIAPDDLKNSELAQLLQRSGIQPDESRAADPSGAASAAVNNSQGQPQAAPAPDPGAQGIAPTDAAKLALEAHKSAAELALKADAQHFDQAHRVTQLAHSMSQPAPMPGGVPPRG